MSLYNTLFGKNSLSNILLQSLGLTEEDCGRFRDAYLDDGKIVIYTRNGGGNRGHWYYAYEQYEAGDNCPCPGCIITYSLPNHPNYIQDYDDDFDNTYAYVEFSIPDKYKEFFLELEKEQLDVETIGTKFATLLDELGAKDS